MDRIVLTDGVGGEWIADVPFGHRERMRGLLGRRELAPGRALLLRGTRAVHTFGMRFAIQAAWLDDSGRVLAVRRMRPGRVSLPRPRSRHVLECREGEAPRMGARLNIGSRG